METAPEKISRYEISGLIARGGMGRIYLARDPDVGRLVVLKLLDATLDSSEIRQRFEREARALASLNHPNIVKIFDNGTFHDSPFIVMEYVRGETLEEKIKRQAPLTLVQKLKLLGELCAGLTHAHQAGIVHRDIKPANLMVDQDDRLKLLDFGIARVADSNLTRTRSGDQWVPLQIGTPGYMSPEQIEGANVDQRTDVFAVGAVAYELFAYREAFPGASAREIDARVRQTPPEPISARVSSFDPAIDAILARALARERNERYPDAAALGQAFDGYRARLNPGAATTRRPALPVELPGASKAETAYAWAVLAYEEKAFDLARRYAIEALAEDPGHEAARTFVAGFEPAPVPVAVPRPGRAGVPPTGSRSVPPTGSRAAQASSRAAVPPAARTAMPPAQARRPEPGPEVVSVDPTVLISRADRAAHQSRPQPAPAASSAPPSWSPPPHVDPTVVIRREDLARTPLQADETMVIGRAARQAQEDTNPVAVPAPAARRRGREPQSTPRAADKVSFGAMLASLWPQRSATPAPPPTARRPGGRAPAPAGPSWTANPATRGILLGVAAFVVAGIVVLALIGVGRRLWTSSPTLALDRPVGGTLTADGLECGTQQDDCSASFSTGSHVTLTATPDKDFLFGGYTGDCAAQGGRLTMDGPHRCGAVFNPAPAVAVASTQPLTITKPQGGTIYALENAACGTLGDQCTMMVDEGRAVTLYASADSGFKHRGWTGDCNADGTTQMTGPRTCGAVFVQGEVNVAPVNLQSPPVRRREPETVIAGGAANPGTPTGAGANAGGAAGANPATGAGAAAGVPPNSGAGTGTQAGTPAGGAPPPLATASGDAKPGESETEHARNEISTLVRTYCRELQTLDARKVQALFATNQLRQLQEQYRQYKSLKCTLGAEPPKFDLLNFGENGKGAANIVFAMKQVIQMKSGGAPSNSESDVTMSLERPAQRAEWKITRVTHEAKPKP